MKKCLLFAAICMSIASCTKKTNNYYANPTPSFTISGIHDIKMQADAIPVAQLNLIVQYMDSAQGRVSLAISSLPAGITLDTNIMLSGIPTFYTNLTFYDTSSTPATPGTYPVTLTCYSSNSTQKTFTFNITVQSEPDYTIDMIGKYTNCSSECVGTVYTDSIYEDAIVQNKIYFHNFMNTGMTVYANVTATSPQVSVYAVNVPQQTVGGYTFYATEGEYSKHPITQGSIFIEAEYTFNGVYSACSVNMSK